MKKVLGVVGIVLLGIIVFLRSELSIEEKRTLHTEYLKNSPFKKTLKLSKKERKAKGLPPNKYFEREWELTINPENGRVEPEKVLELQSKLKTKQLLQKSPGDAVDNPWIERGPNNVGGRTRVLLFDPNDPEAKRVFAGSVSGGLWVNNDITDEDSSWIQVTSVPSNMNISCLTVDPRDSNIWYLGTGEQYTFGAVVGNGVYKSIDGGTTWTQLDVLAAGSGDLSSIGFTLLSGVYFINDIIAWDNGTSTEVFVGVGSHIYGDSSDPVNFLGSQSAGLYRSLDAGLNWSRLESSTFEFSFRDLTFYQTPNDLEIAADNTLWMGGIAPSGFGTTGGGTVFKSTDGETWHFVTTLPSSNRVELAVSSSDGDKLFALTEGTSSDGPHIYGTTDAFATTVELSKPVDANSDISADDFTRDQSFYNLMIEVDPRDDGILYVGGINLFRSDDNAASWSQISKSFTDTAIEVSEVHADQHAMAFRIGNSNQAVFGNDGGVYYGNSLSAAGFLSSVITARVTDFNVTQFYHSAIVSKDSDEFLMAGSQDNGTHVFQNTNIKGPDSSMKILSGDGAYCFFDQVGKDYLIASAQNNFFILFDFNTNSWKTINDDVGDGSFINEGDLDSNLDILYVNGTAGSINQIYGYSNLENIPTDGLAEKTVLANGLLDSEPIAFKVSPFTTNSTTLLVGTKTGKLIKIKNADGSPTWSDISGSSFLGSISDIEFGDSEKEILVSFHNYGVESIWYSNDGGSSWTSKEGDLPDFPVKAILSNPLEQDEVIIGTELGVWKTENWSSSSPNWVRTHNGMKDVKVTDLQLRNDDYTVLASTYGRGLFTGMFFDDGVDSGEIEVVIPKGFTPNNDGINDYWEIKNIGKIYPNNTIEIYNKSHQLVYKESSYNNDWNGDSNIGGSVEKLPIGSYMYIVNFGEPTLDYYPKNEVKKGWVYIKY